MTDNTLSAPLTAEEQAEFQDALWRLLSAQAARFTMGESTSLPAEQTEALLASIVYTLGVSPDDPERIRRCLSAGLERALHTGQSRLQWKLRQGERLWQAACLTAPDVGNRSLTDTLKSIGTFWKRYDWRYFACEIPCDIDYQLSRPVPDMLEGVDYVNEYLRRLLTENRFLARLELPAVERVLAASCPDYRGLLINLFEPPAAVALGRALLGEDPRTLEMTDRRRNALGEKLGCLPPETLRRTLEDGAERLADVLGAEEAERACLRQFAGDLCPRLSAAMPTGDLTGVFPGG